MERIASTRHTLILLGILTLLAIGGYRANAHRDPGAAAPNHMVIYGSLLVGQLLLIRYVKVGLRGVTLRDLAGRRWSSARDVLVDVVLAAAFWWVSIFAIQWLKQRMGGIDDHTSSYLPHGLAESALWIAISIVAGICEEITFRGYFQRQFTAWTGNAAAGIVLQAVVFGASHGYQGIRSTIVISFFGLLFGVLAWARKSLLPGMLAHAATDIISGLQLIKG